MTGLHPSLSRIFTGLASLVDKSLLRQEDTGGFEAEGGEPRFTLLETIREYSMECLSASGEVEAIRQRHARFFMALAEEAELRDSRGVEENATWIERLEM